MQERLLEQVWLRRQEAEALKVRLLAQGFQELVMAVKEQEFTSKLGEIYDKIIASMFPFLKDIRKDEDKEVKDTMLKELSKGRVYFSPLDSPLGKVRGAK